MHCINAEDEDFEICQHEEDVFPEEATIKCIENRLGYDIEIWAKPCDGVQDCRDGSDENCDDRKDIHYGVVIGLILLTNVIYHYLKWHCLKWSSQNILSTDSRQISFAYNSSMGDDLANIKVSQTFQMNLKI